MSDVIAFEDLRSPAAWRATLAEFIATLLFVFIGAGAVVSTGIIDGEMTSGRLLAIAIAHGMAITIMVSATARWSGGHLNPAVTIAAVATRKIGVTKGVMYMAAQLIGATIAALLLAAVMPDASEGGVGAHALGSGISAGAGLVVEMILTFILVFVIFATAMDPKRPSHLAPIAIGLAVMVDSLVGGPLTGASMNPARSFGPALVSGEWADHWVFWVGPILGGMAAALIYQIVYLRQSEEEA
jgi:MIP family channel proteins